MTDFDTVRMVEFEIGTLVRELEDAKGFPHNYEEVVELQDRLIEMLQLRISQLEASAND